MAQTPTRASACHIGRQRVDKLHAAGASRASPTAQLLLLQLSAGTTSHGRRRVADAASRLMRAAISDENAERLHLGSQRFNAILHGSEGGFAIAST
jgi:hypothetical protein